MKFKDTKYGDLTGKIFEGSIDVSMLSLTSLEGAPKEVTGSFDCNGNHLTTLEFAPLVIGDFLNCSHNKLTSLEHCPQKIHTFIDFGSNRITSLKGFPKELGGSCYGDHNFSLMSLEGIVEIHDIIDFTGIANKHWLQEYKLRVKAPKMSESKLKMEMYKLTKDPIFLPNALKKVFLIKDKK